MTSLQSTDTQSSSSWHVSHTHGSTSAARLLQGQVNSCTDALTVELQGRAWCWSMYAYMHQCCPRVQVMISRSDQPAPADPEPANAPATAVNRGRGDGRWAHSSSGMGKGELEGEHPWKGRLSAPVEVAGKTGWARAWLHCSGAVFVLPARAVLLGYYCNWVLTWQCRACQAGGCFRLL
jgi:hypothetical protein